VIAPGLPRMSSRPRPKTLSLSFYNQSKTAKAETKGRTSSSRV
jgi:hypothetical protein